MSVLSEQEQLKKLYRAYREGKGKGKGDIKLYPKSFQSLDEALKLFMVREERDKYLIVQGDKERLKQTGFRGDYVEAGGLNFLKCSLSHENAEAVRDHLEFTRPVIIGKSDSYGLGDRLGNAGPAHIRAIRNTGFKPVLAQQSIRELDRTQRTAENVMDAASWAVLQEGYRDGFGADADHLKTVEDIDRMVVAGFTMFTIDPSDHVRHDAGLLSNSDLEEQSSGFNWALLKTTVSELISRYSEKELKLNHDFHLQPTKREVYTAAVKYGGVLLHAKKMTDYLKLHHSEKNVEIELSIDETEEPTSPFEHYFIASELDRLGIELVSLAPRFCGEFEKGIDFKGDLEEFKTEYLQHIAIAEVFGGYKLSIHSGSDKFSIYNAIGSLSKGNVHVKTAGTSYLEALRSIAEAEPELFKDILHYSLGRFDIDKKTYFISAEPGTIPRLLEEKKGEEADLLDNPHVRQVLHVTYGSVLTKDDHDFRKHMMECLAENETIYEENLLKHFHKHLNPFGKNEQS